MSEEKHFEKSPGHSAKLTLETSTLVTSSLGIKDGEVGKDESDMLHLIYLIPSHHQTQFEIHSCTLINKAILCLQKRKRIQRKSGKNKDCFFFYLPNFPNYQPRNTYSAPDNKMVLFFLVHPGSFQTLFVLSRTLSHKCKF